MKPLISLKLWLQLLAVALLLALILVAARFIVLLGANNPQATQAKIVVIEPHSSRATVAKTLADDRIIQSPVAFLLYLRLIRADILPGPYRLSANESAWKIGGILLSGRLATVTITLPEDWRATDIENYLVSTKKLPQFKGFAVAANQYEGYLFPDTYNIRVDETTPQLIALLRTNFQKQTAALGTVSPQTVILASIVEREAGPNDTRALIAGVYTHRLQIGMNLQADPTVQYALGSWAPITGADTTSVISPYNTYLNPGLPPGPICNPGLASLKAALRPTQTSYLYFFSAHGQTYYSNTLAEQQQKIQEYLD